MFKERKYEPKILYLANWLSCRKGTENYHPHLTMEGIFFPLAFLRNLCRSKLQITKNDGRDVTIAAGYRVTWGLGLRVGWGGRVLSVTAVCPSNVIFGGRVGREHAKKVNFLILLVVVLVLFTGAAVHENKWAIMGYLNSIILCVFEKQNSEDGRKGIQM